MSGWAALAGELARWRAAGRLPELWWRDDDAAAPTPALRRLLAVSSESGVPLAVAAIALACEGEALQEAQFVVMHGCDHRNRASSGEKKTEFPVSESDAAALERLARARERLARLAEKRFIPVLAPPWNRIRENLISRLPEAGLHGLSRYGARGAPKKGVCEVNTHVDIIAWRRDRRFLGEDEALGLLVQQLEERRAAAGDEPVGLLTHHALHDAETWRFLERLFDETRAGGAVWRRPEELFLRRL